MLKLNDKKALFLAYLLLIGAILFLSSCSQSKKVQKAKETLLSNPSELAKICAERFPAQETTVYIPGETITDTVYSFQEVMIPVECPPSDSGVVIQWKVKTVRETVTVNKTDTVNKVTVDKAKEISLLYEIDRLEAKNKELQAKVATLKKYRDWIWILIICLVIVGGLWFWFKGKTSVINSILNRSK